MGVRLAAMMTVSDIVPPLAVTVVDDLVSAQSIEFINQESADDRNVGDDGQSHDHEEYERQGVLEDLRHGFLKAITGEEDIHAERRRQVADLHPGEKDDGQMVRI